MVLVDSWGDVPISALPLLRSGLLPTPPPAAAAAAPQVGAGGTCAWKLCTLGANTTLAVVYDITAQHGSAAPDAMGAGAHAACCAALCCVLPCAAAVPPSPPASGGLGFRHLACLLACLHA